jgi:tRNA threonylcarbamoyladenosine biosynthesis protein TsaB
VLTVAIESATDTAAVALADESGVKAAVSVAGGRRHTETLVPAVEFCCRRTGVALGEVQGICVDVGPGLFTGLRVGVATAKGLAFALGVPVACATSLEVIAHAMVSRSGADEEAVYVPVVDARRGEVFSARFAASVADRHSGSCRATERVIGLSPPERSKPEELARSLSHALPRTPAGSRFVLAGGGARRYRAMFSGTAGVRVEDDLESPPVETLVELGVGRLVSGETVAARSVIPVYLRDADVRINWEQRLAPSRPAAARG